MRSRPSTSRSASGPPKSKCHSAGSRTMLTPRAEFREPVRPSRRACRSVQDSAPHRRRRPSCRYRARRSQLGRGRASSERTGCQRLACSCRNRRVAATTAPCRVDRGRQPCGRARGRPRGASTCRPCHRTRAAARRPAPGLRRVREASLHQSGYPAFGTRLETCLERT